MVIFKPVFRHQQALVSALEVQRQTRGTCALLMDVNIFWRTLRLAYANEYAEHNVRGALDAFCPVLGIWHAYAHSLKKVHEVFLPWWAALEIPRFLEDPEVSVVYTKPKLITIEHMVMGLFLAADSVEEELKRTVAEAIAEYGEDSPQAQQSQGLLLLVTEYCPALVEMGMAVRQCFWATQDVNTGLVQVFFKL